MANVRRAVLADAAAIARVHVDTWRTAYRGLMPDAILDRLRYDEREAFWSRELRGRGGRHFSFVAEESGVVVGFSSGGPERSGNPDYLGELYAIYLIEERQRGGLGRLLFDAVVEQLVSDGLYSMMLWVLRGNPACGFYEAMGGVRIGEKEERFGDSVIVEVAYGWKQLGSYQGRGGRP